MSHRRSCSVDLKRTMGRHRTAQAKAKARYDLKGAKVLVTGWHQTWNSNSKVKQQVIEPPGLEVVPRRTSCSWFHMFVEE